MSSVDGISATRYLRDLRRELKVLLDRAEDDRLRLEDAMERVALIHEAVLERPLKPERLFPPPVTHFRTPAGRMGP